jgi:cytochrome d ubiquinol oxidase subunit II
MPEITPALLVAAGLAVALAAYLVMAGADFGGGVWDLFATGPRRKRQRALIAESIGPIWEANHVWLILAVVLLFVCFPGLRAAVGVAPHSAHAEAGRQRAARIGLHLPHRRPPKR